MLKAGIPVLPRLSLSTSGKNTQGLFDLNYFLTSFIAFFQRAFTLPAPVIYIASL